MRGEVISFNRNSGWGFIYADGADYFVHWSDIISVGYRTLHAGDLVEFDPTTTIKGLSAANVRRVTSEY